MTHNNSLVVLSMNCRGLKNKEKCADVLNYLKDKNPDILCLQETHWIENDLTYIRDQWGGECIVHGISSNSRGVAILFGKNFDYKIGNVEKDNGGNLLCVSLTLDSLKIKVINVYGPNTDYPSFYKNLFDSLSSSEEDHILICGDLNLTLNPKMDTFNYARINNPRSRKIVLDMIEGLNLLDTYRYLNPTTTRFTWRRKTPLQQARLDYCLCSRTLTDLIHKSDILPGYRTDHSLLKVVFHLSKFQQGKGLWKFNTSLLHEPEYLKIINDSIADEITKYAIPVYNLDYLKLSNGENIELTIDDNLFLETLLLRLRGETIKFASHLKKSKTEYEEKLKEEILNLEKSANIHAVINLLQDKKEELENIRIDKMKGHLVRSRAKWLQQGEKPTRLFCSLENKNFTEKTIKQIKKDNGSILTDQKEILNEIRNYYQNLFDAKHCELENVDLNKYITPKNHLNYEQSKRLETELTMKELGQALKNMKNSKTPGIDGFPAEFFKVFWNKLKFIVHRTSKYAYRIGKLPITMRQCVISCLPKGNKDRSNLRNWRPISLLSVLYKIISAAVANRLKTILDVLVDKTQTGFIQGRYIGYSTRLVYDIMHHCKKFKKEGLLMLIDFEKAFDSLSWNFLHNVLTFFGFGKNFIQWIKLFNYNIQATIIQCGFLSDFFSIRRGCHQGDPCSPFLFILCGQILSQLIENNHNIRGIKLGSIEYKLTQFADDTTLILDGSRESLQSSLNVLEIFGSMSGLKMNKSKTKLVWIGRKSYCRDKLDVNTTLEWGITEFSLLGIEFSVDLERMVQLNYNKAIAKSKLVLENWKKRSLTPFGKITIIKTFIISIFNHLIIALPNPTPSEIKTITEMMFKFLWHDKPDKISREQICKDYSEGGLKMIQLDYFIKALKSTWVRRLICDFDSPWSFLANYKVDLSKGLTSFGSDWCTHMLPKIDNPFWADVLKSWQYVSNRCPGQSKDIFETPLWYNKNIGQSVFYPQWYKKNIVFVSDLLDRHGKFYEMHDLKNMYCLEAINILEYYRIKILVKSFLKKHDSPLKDKIIRPLLSSDIRILLQNTKGSAAMYKVLNKTTTKIKIKQKWKEDINQDESNETWKKIFECCFKFKCDASLTWFQYRLLYRILGVRKYLVKIGKDTSSLCRLCSNQEEAIVHLFYSCPKSQELWIAIENWLRIRLNIFITLNVKTVLFGYLEKSRNYDLVNLMILHGKKYIFQCALNYNHVNIYVFQKKFKSIFYEHLSMLHMNTPSETCANLWKSWESLFVNI